MSMRLNIGQRAEISVCSDYADQAIINVVRSEAVKNGTGSERFENAENQRR